MVTETETLPRLPPQAVFSSSFPFFLSLPVKWKDKRIHRDRQEHAVQWDSVPCDPVCLCLHSGLWMCWMFEEGFSNSIINICIWIFGWFLIHPLFPPILREYTHTPSRPITVVVVPGMCRSYISGEVNVRSRLTVSIQCRCVTTKFHRAWLQCHSDQNWWRLFSTMIVIPPEAPQLVSQTENTQMVNFWQMPLPATSSTEQLKL